MAKRPPEEWFSRCVAGVTESGGAKKRLGGPPAVCGRVWFDKSAAEQAKIIRKMQAEHPYEVKFGRKTVSLHTSADAAERSARVVGGVARKRSSKKVLYAVTDSQNRTVVHACSCEAAHRAARSGKHLGSSVNFVK